MSMSWNKPGRATGGTGRVAAARGSAGSRAHRLAPRRARHRPAGLAAAFAILVLAAAYRPEAFADGADARQRYAKVERQLAFMLASGASLRLLVAIDERASGPLAASQAGAPGSAAPSSAAPASAAPGDASEKSAAIAAELRSLFTASFSREPRFALVAIEPVRELLGPGGSAASGGAAATSPAAATSLAATSGILARCAELGATVVLIVSEERYASGGGEMEETEARLLDLASKQELARDVVWTLVSSSGQKAVFVDGERAN